MLEKQLASSIFEHFCEILLEHWDGRCICISGMDEIGDGIYLHQNLVAHYGHFPLVGSGYTLVILGVVRAGEKAAPGKEGSESGGLPDPVICLLLWKRIRWVLYWSICDV